jgi:L-seryl-tRNA(Ser) seleniumtransferase
MSDPRRGLPSVNALLEAPALQELLARAPRPVVADAVRAAIARVRGTDASPPATLAAWSEVVATELEALDAVSLVPVLNATGVVLHTNLGRAPLAAAAISAIARTASGASNLEYDLTRGHRGSRYVHCVSLLTALTGAEDALVVNNCAAALVLALGSHAAGREAVISRGELIEIGDSFRVPEIMTRSGAILREVGTTNRTHADDYRKACGASTGAIVKVHRSNFEQRGFVAEASLRELAPIARDGAVPLIHDFGSGLLLALDAWGLSGEPLAADCIRDGATLVAMSGDKLLGGPQAGILLGSAAAIAECRRNPLTRALRVDKLTLAALEATLRLYRDRDVAVREVPVLAMLTTPVDSLHTRALALTAELTAAGCAVTVQETRATVGGGAFPTASIPSRALAFSRAPERLEEALRRGRYPVIGRLERDRLLLDLRSIPPGQDAELQRAIMAAELTVRPTVSSGVS